MSAVSWAAAVLLVAITLAACEDEDDCPGGCEIGFICRGSCVPGCFDDAGCPAGFRCIPTQQDCARSSMACEHPDDECRTQEDCDDPDECLIYGTGHRGCRQDQCGD